MIERTQVQQVNRYSWALSKCPAYQCIYVISNTNTYISVLPMCKIILRACTHANAMLLRHVSCKRNLFSGCTLVQSWKKGKNPLHFDIIFVIFGKFYFLISNESHSAKEFENNGGLKFGILIVKFIFNHCKSGWNAGSYLCVTQNIL